VSSHKAVGCILGKLDLLRAVAMAGIPCVSVSPEGALARVSRYSTAAVLHDPRAASELLLERLLAFAGTVDEPPVLFYQGDADTLFISRFRGELGARFRFVIPDATLVEDLIDKARFQALAERLHLPVPPAIWLTPERPPSRDTEVRFPALVKPFARQLASWQPLAGHAKAVQVDSFEDLTRVWAETARLGTSVLVQQLIPGDETKVESYHAYVDKHGAIAAEFTGRKVRTFPVRFGQSTALELTAQADVRALGRDLLGRLGLRGVAKFDFKRAPNGQLHLLEVNPRFNLWHHLGAVAGVNIPAFVYADLTGTPRPPSRCATPGTGWSRPVEDLRSVRAAGQSLATWIRWTLRARARSGIALDDPMPMLAWAIRSLPRIRPAQVSTTPDMPA
jgi:D-aspartate ligase